VCEEVARTVDLTAHHLAKCGVRVITDFAPGVPSIQADRQQLRQVLLNLFANAADAMPRGGRLAIRVAPGAVGGGRPGVVIETEDTGVGIPPDVLPRVTEPFFTTKAEGKGTGLGLSICRRIVDEHGGTLVIESRPGVGTTVRVTLPLRPPSTVPDREPERGCRMNGPGTGYRRPVSAG
jgi:signal transduction histidine kinase